MLLYSLVTLRRKESTLFEKYHDGNLVITATESSPRTP